MGRSRHLRTERDVDGLLQRVLIDSSGAALRKRCHTKPASCRIGVAKRAFLPQ